MKNIFIILSIFTIALNCKAQSPVFDLLDMQNRIKDIYGAYHKDMNNLLNPFEGTYVYSNGNILLKIILKKKVMSSMNGYLYEDLIVGEYQYIENGIEKINTLNELSVNHPNAWNYSIGANRIITSGNTGCEECLPNEKALSGGLAESSTHNTADLIIRRINVNGIQAIKIFVMWRMRYKKETDPMPPKASFPGGEYILTRRLER